jgi:predicted NBD/HSP70 family sugar kinase
VAEGQPGVPSGISALVPLLEGGEPVAVEACRRAGAALGMALTSAVNLLDPDTIVLGGIFAPLFPWISGPAAATMTPRLGQMRGTVPPLVPSRAGPDAATLGAAGQVIQQIIAEPAAFLTDTPSPSHP